MKLLLSILWIATLAVILWFIFIILHACLHCQKCGVGYYDRWGGVTRGIFRYHKSYRDVVETHELLEHWNGSVAK